MLGQCTPLAVLVLDSNPIGADGAVMLVDVMGQCLSLAELNLGGNEIGDEWAGRLALWCGRKAKPTRGRR